MSSHRKRKQDLVDRSENMYMDHDFDKRIPRILRHFPQRKSSPPMVETKDKPTIVIKDVFSLASAPATVVKELEQGDECNLVTLEEVPLEVFELDGSESGKLAADSSSILEPGHEDEDTNSRFQETWDRSRFPLLANRLNIEDSMSALRDFEANGKHSNLTNLQALDKQSRKGLYCCDICGKALRCARNLREHRRLHNGQKPFSCSKCHEKFRWAVQLKRHSCQTTRAVNDPASPETHERGSSPENSLDASTDQSVISDPSSSGMANENLFQCGLCPSAFPNRLLYTRHQLAHQVIQATPKIPHRLSCDVCGRSFSRNNSLVQHRRSCVRLKRM